MRSNQSVRRNLAFAAVALLPLGARADTSVSISASVQGFFTSYGKNVAGFGAGPGSIICGSSSIGGFRNYFTFLFPAGLLPPGQQVLSATLVAGMPFRGYASPDISETWTLFDVSPSNNNILQDQSTPVTNATHVFADLGTGHMYGSRIILPSQATSPTDTPIDVSLNQTFCTELSAKLAIPGEQFFAVGGALTTLEGSHGQLLFGYSGYGGRATLTFVLGTPLAPCPGDLNGDRQVDDSDFVTFAVAYNILDCADPAMPGACPSDLNADGFVDDSDFVAFAAAYDALVCP